MSRIPKNLSDKDMLKGFEEPESYEKIFLAADESPKPVKSKKISGSKESLEQSFVSPELAEQIGKELMSLKLELYKEGIVDYRIKVSRDAKKIVLTPVENKRKKI